MVVQNDLASVQRIDDFGECVKFRISFCSQLESYVLSAGSSWRGIVEILDQPETTQ